MSVAERLDVSSGGASYCAVSLGMQSLRRFAIRLLAATAVVSIAIAGDIREAQACRLVEHLLQEREATNLESSFGRGSAARSRSGGASLADVSTETLVALLEVRSQLAAVSQQFPPVGVCADTNLNATALVPDGDGKQGAIIFTTALLHLLGSDADNIASVMSHEFAHIVEEHPLLLQSLNRRADLVGLEKGISTVVATGNLDAGALAGAVESLKIKRAFSREIELRADSVGYQIYLTAGFDPAKVTVPLQLLVRIDGKQDATWLDSHPNIEERIIRLAAIASDDVARSERAANAQAQAKLNVPYLHTAITLWHAGDLKQLDEYVSGWLSDTPDSSRAWYFKGLLVQSNDASRHQAWEAFERSVHFDPTFSTGWDALCASLLESGFRKQSAVCVAGMQSMGHDISKVLELTWDNRLWIGGLSHTPSKGMYWNITPDGSILITNHESIATSYGNVVETLPPPWVPLSH